VTFKKILIGNDRYAMFRTGSIEVQYTFNVASFAPFTDAYLGAYFQK
jgi:hypothetical protein